MPLGWTVQAGPARTAGQYVTLRAPNGSTVGFTVVAPRTGMPTHLLLPVLRETARASDRPVLVVANYIGATLRDLLAAEGFSFADATGWVRLAVDNPLILLTGRGADRAPRDRTSSAVTRLNGIAANRTIRALTTSDLPLGVRALAAAAQVSPGSVSKLLVTLATEGAVDRDDTGRVTAVRARAVVRRWVADYGFTTSNRGAEFFIAPRGLSRTLQRLTSTPLVALTGSAAARTLLPDGVVPVVPLTLLAVYTPTPTSLAADLGLIPATASTANVVIAAPQDPDILSDDGVSVAPATLVLADLLTLPGRSDAEAEQLMNTLSVTNRSWEDTNGLRA